MPFGLTNAPAAFQRAVDIILAGFKWQTCPVYLDDIIVFSRNEEDNLAHLDEVLTALENAGVTLNLSMCSFFTKAIKYLGHVIKLGTLEVAESATRTLRGLRYPESFTELRCFFGSLQCEQEICQRLQRHRCAFVCPPEIQEAAQ